MDLMLRRRAMMGAVEAGPAPDIEVPITWGGTGADITSSTVIDATERDAFYNIPFIQGDSRLQTTATASTNAVKLRAPALYSDAACTQFVGYYNISTGQIVSSRPTTTQSPWLKFDTEVKVVPRGYYAKMLLTKSGSDAFSSNDNCRSYMKARAKTVYLRK